MNTRFLYVIRLFLTLRYCNDFSFFTFHSLNVYLPAMKELLRIIGWFLLSSVKYPYAVLPLLTHSHRFWFFNMLIVASGGCLGVLVFTFLGRAISKFFGRYHLFKIRYKNLRRFVRLKNGYGLVGIAFLTPLLISIPIGVILSATIEHHKWRVIRLHCLSVIFWSVLFFGLEGLFGIKF